MKTATFISLAFQEGERKEEADDKTDDDDDRMMHGGKKTRIQNVDVKIVRFVNNGLHYTFGF